MGRPVIVAGIDSDDGKHLFITVCLNPSEAYVSKNQKHLGFVIAGEFVPDQNVQVSEVDKGKISAAYHYLLGAIQGIHT